MNKIYNNLLNQAEKIARHNRQGSYKTRKRYFEAYMGFLMFLAATFHLQRIANIAPEHLFAYVKYRQEQGKSASTIKTELSAIRFFHDQIPNARHELPTNDMLGLARRKYGGVDRTWSAEEYDRAMELCRQFGETIFAACISIAHQTGLRIHEVMRIDTATARAALKNGKITIKGKGGKMRDVPIKGDTCDILRQYLENTKAGHKLFVPDGVATDVAIAELQKFLRTHRTEIEDAGREKPLTFHGLRHSCASLLLANSVSMKEIQDWLGHSSYNTTANIYAHLDSSSKMSSANVIANVLGGTQPNGQQKIGA